MSVLTKYDLIEPIYLPQSVVTYISLHSVYGHGSQHGLIPWLTALAGCQQQAAAAAASFLLLLWTYRSYLTESLVDIYPTEKCFQQKL
jgi:hypothetical protein